MSKAGKVVLAYSGGLDTSVILKWLIERQYAVTALIVDLGQKEDLKKAAAKAEAVGAHKVVVEDARHRFVTGFMFEALKASARYEGRYLMGTALARPVIAEAMVKYAKAEDAQFVAHGATGKGNDQVRFELGSYALNPSIRIIAPWKTPEFLQEFTGRQELLDYAAKHDIEVEATRAKPYSVDANLMHISYESGVLEDPSQPAPPGMFRMTRDLKDTPDMPASLAITFQSGVPVAVENKLDGTKVTDPVALVEYLNTVAGEHGVGRLDLVENRYVGMKSRGVYETPGFTVLWQAHQDLEILTMDREVYRIKEGLSAKFGDLAYNGYWFSPEMNYLRACLDASQDRVTGTVSLDLFKGHVLIQGRSSPFSLYNQALVSMDVEGGYNQIDALGFIRTNSVRLKNFTLAKHPNAGTKY